MEKSIFGPFNPYLDEFIHMFLSFLVSLTGYFLGLSFPSAVLIFLIGSFLIDIDHVFNSFICTVILKVPNYRWTLTRGDQGYSPKIFHGIDIALVAGIICAIQINALFGTTLFLSLFVHLCWDFVVYPDKATELLFITRMMQKFNVGKRSYFVGKIFDYKTLTW